MISEKFDETAEIRQHWRYMKSSWLVTHMRVSGDIAVLILALMAPLTPPLFF
jgi:hypothetical protein